MSESPFVTISKVISEDTLLSDSLDILAKDIRGIPAADREILVEAAEELRADRKRIIAQAQEIMELKGQLAAAAERIRALEPPTPYGYTIPMSMATQAQVNSLYEGQK